MSYIVDEEIETSNLSKEAKNALAIYGYAMSVTNNANREIHECRRLADTITQAKKIENIKSEPGKALHEKILRQVSEIESQCRDAVQDIEDRCDINEARLEPALKEMENNELKWRNRSLDIVSTITGGYRVPFEGDKPGYTIDSQRVLEEFFDDLKEALPNDFPISAFKFDCIAQKTPVDLGESRTVGVLSFNKIYEPAVTEAVLKLTERKINESEEEIRLRGVDINECDPLKEPMKYKDAVAITQSIPYSFQVDPLFWMNGKVTTCLLQADDAKEAAKGIAYESRSPLVDLDRYANTDEKLYDFVHDSFGGIIGRTRDGFENASMRCLEHFTNEMSQKVNLTKLLDAFDRKHGVGMALDTNSLSP